MDSGSQGNCYLFEAKEETLIIELGINFKNTLKGLNFDLTKVVGALVSHEHQDHCKGVKDALKMGVDVYMSKGTHKGLNNYETRNNRREIESNLIKYISHGKEFSLGKFRIMPFNVKHDVIEPLGFLINHPDSGTTMFITDSYYCEYKFENLDNIIIEANYSDEIIEQHVFNGKLPSYRYDRTITSHMSLKTCKMFLAANDLKRCRNILLIHLSDSNSNAVQFQKEVAECTGKNVVIASKGISVSFGHPF